MLQKKGKKCTALGLLQTLQKNWGVFFQICRKKINYNTRQARVGANPAIQLHHQSSTTPRVGAQHPNAVLTWGGGGCKHCTICKQGRKKGGIKQKWVQEWHCAAAIRASAQHPPPPPTLPILNPIYIYKYIYVYLYVHIHMQ